MIRALAVMTASITLGAVPVFFLGAQAVLIRDELDFSEAKLGAAASLYYLASAVASVPAGRLAERLGARRMIVAAAAGTTVALLGIAVTRSWPSLVGCMLLAGLANGFALPATNLGVTQAAPPGRRGFAFGVKQTSGTLATLLAGSAVPALGLTVGWRWAFVVPSIVGVALVVWGLAGRYRSPLRQERTVRGLPTGPLVTLAVAGACAVFGGSSLAAFYVSSAVAQGTGPGAAGTFLAVGSAFGVAARIGWGWVGDRCGRAQFLVLGGMLAAGATGFGLLGVAGSGVRLGLATMLIFGMGWAWSGLFNFAVADRIPAAPAAATGITGTGQFTGGIVGPAGFGLLLERSSYLHAWLAVAACVLLAGVLVVVGGAWLHRRTGL